MMKDTAGQFFEHIIPDTLVLDQTPERLSPVLGPFLPAPILVKVGHVRQSPIRRRLALFEVFLDSGFIRFLFLPQG